MSTARQLWIAPAFDGPNTGGTIYNRSLCAALSALHSACDTCDTCDLHGFFTRGPSELPSVAWLDSLYLLHAPVVRAQLPRSVRFGLVMHYLPSLVHAASTSDRERLRDLERLALANADLCIAPSVTLAASLRALDPLVSVVCIEPGVSDAICDLDTALPRVPCAALMVANLTENKGVLAFLEALASCVQAEDPFRLTVIGHHELDPAYAAACCALVACKPQLRERVSLIGGFAHGAVLAQLARSTLFISASRTESYGMALAEARALGVPILARSGGHVAAHVDPSAGGELVEDEAQLAHAFVRVLRAPNVLRQRTLAARCSLRTRSWREAALELCAAVDATL